MRMHNANAADAWLVKLNECFLKFSADPFENINLLTALCGELTGASCALYNRLNDNGLVCSWGQWNLPRDYPVVDQPQGRICYDLITQARESVVVIRDLPKTHYFQTDPNVARYNLQTYVGKTVKFNERLVGSLCILFQSDFEPDSNDEYLIGLIAAAIGVEEKRFQDRKETQQSEERFRALVQNASDIISIHDLTGIIRYVTPSVTRMLGYTPEELIGKNAFEFVHPDDFDAVRASFASTAQRGSSGIPIEFRFRAPDGGWVFLESLGNNLLDAPSVRGIVLNTRNVSERKHTEQALRDSEISYRGLFNSVAEAIYIQDRDGYFVDVNRGALKMYGYPREFFIGKTPAVLAAPGKNDLAKTLTQVQRAFEGEPQQFEFWGLRSDGEVFPKDVRAYPGTYFGRKVVITLAQDITERKRIEEALQASERRNLALIEAFPDIILVMARNGTIADARVPKNAWEIPAEFLIGQHLEEIGVPSETVTEIMKRIHHTLDTGEMQSLEYEYPMTQGITFWDARAVALNSDHALIIIRDISERKRAEQRSQIFSKLGHQLSSATSPHQAAQIIVTLADELLGWDACYLDLYSAEQDRVTPILAMDIVHGKRTECAMPHREHPGPTARRVLNEGAVLIQRFDAKDVSPLERFGDTTRISASIIAVPIRNGATPIGFLSIHNYTPNAYNPSAVETLQALADHAGSALERMRAQEALRLSEKRFRALIENSVDVITLLNANGTILYESPSMLRVFNADPEALVGQSLLQIMNSINIAYDAEYFRRVVETPDLTVPIETSYRHVDGSQHWLEGVAKNLLHEPSVGAIVVNFRDVTERKFAEAQLRASLKEKEVLLKEMHHRVKNNLQVVSSLLSLQTRQVKDSTSLEMLRDSQNRIRSMALVHEKLYQSQDLARVDFAGYLQNLAAFLFHSYQVDASGIALHIRATPQVRLGIDVAIPCGLIVNELVSNALKHAFPNKRAGKIWIDLTRQDDRQLKLIVGDDGVGLPPELDYRATTSLGLQLVTTLTDQLEGTLALHREHGTVFEITFADASHG